MLGARTLDYIIQPRRSLLDFTCKFLYFDQNFTAKFEGFNIVSVFSNQNILSQRSIELIKKHYTLAKLTYSHANIAEESNYFVNELESDHLNRFYFLECLK
jgi:hypothetical protein